MAQPIPRWPVKACPTDEGQDPHHCRHRCLSPNGGRQTSSRRVPRTLRSEGYPVNRALESFIRDIRFRRAGYDLLRIHETDAPWYERWALAARDGLLKLVHKRRDAA